MMMTIMIGGNYKVLLSEKLSSYECHSHHSNAYLYIHSFIDFRGEGRLAEYADGRKKIFTSVSE
jgi:hypothetical protein